MQVDETITREQFIAAYVGRARAVGFPVEPTADGCIYRAEPDMGLEEEHMVAVPCSCAGHSEGWHMVDAGQASEALARG